MPEKPKSNNIEAKEPKTKYFKPASVEYKVFFLIGTSIYIRINFVSL
jgi:hypothetical protein